MMPHMHLVKNIWENQLVFLGMLPVSAFMQQRYSTRLKEGPSASGIKIWILEGRYPA